jgi:glycosyltransferase involved in cell wall biosynthesis
MPPIITNKLRRVDQSPSRLLSIVIPFFNEQAVLPQCLACLRRVASHLAMPVEFIFVDDGSTDGGAEFLANAALKYPEIVLVRLSRNFGKEAAVTAGVDHARGDALVILDADLQDPPELIPQMIAAWSDGADVVLMRRRSRQGESRLKRASAYLFYRLLNSITDHAIPPDVGDFRLMSRKAVDALRQLPERNRYMKGLFAWVGMKTCILDYDRAPRAAGTTKWDYLALLRLAFEGITSFSIEPLRWATMIGVGAAFLGGLFGLWIVMKTLFLGEVVAGYTSIMAMITFLGGVQLLAVGILGEYVGKTYMESKGRPVYLTQEVIRTEAVAAPVFAPNRGVRG